MNTQPSNSDIGVQILTELREVFGGALIVDDEGQHRLVFPRGYVPYAYDLAYWREHKVEMVAALTKGAIL